MLKNESPVISGDCEQSRDFISVKRIVDANILAAESKETGTFNIGLGKSTTINQLFEIINDVLKTDIKPVYENERPGDIKHSVADISKARSIGFKGEDNFKDDLRETIHWFKNKK